MKIELKNVKVNKALSEETACFSATLYIDGKKAAEVSNRGQGGCNEFRFSDRVLEQKFYDWCKSQPAEKTEYGELSMDSDLFINLLIEKQENDKYLRKQLKNKVFYRLKDKTYKSDEWSVLSTAFNAKIKEQLVQRHGDNLGEILNETAKAG